MAENLTLIDAERIEKAGGPWTKLALIAIKSCPKIKKEREIIVLCDRFGIEKTPKTLNAIGKKYGVTRERIRQIVNNTLKKIQKYSNSEDVAKKIAQIEKLAEQKGGLITKSTISDHFKATDQSEQNAIYFIATLSTKLVILKDSNSLKHAWMTKSVKTTKVKEISKKATELLREKKKILKASEIAKSINEDQSLVEAVLSATKAIMPTDFGEWGLTSWPHVNPKSIRDKSKYILARHAKPIHYVELTQKIINMGSKNVTKQSVHNELIKNEDFVLVGRGLYAMREWGFTPGVVEEVIAEVLIEAGQPLHKKDIVTKVLERRYVKESTIILNLQKNRFKRVGKAVYTLN